MQKIFKAAVVAVALLLMSGAGASARTQIYLFSGLGDFIGWGTTTLAGTLSRCGTVNRANHMSAFQFQDQIKQQVARGDRIALIGHSMGGAAAAGLADHLGLTGKHVVVTLDSHFASTGNLKTRKLLLTTADVPTSHIAFANDPRVVGMVRRAVCS